MAWFEVRVKSVNNLMKIMLKFWMTFQEVVVKSLYNFDNGDEVSEDS